MPASAALDWLGACSSGRGRGTMIAAAYTRKSNDEGQKSAELKSTQLQLDEIRAFAASRGWTLDNRYIWSDDAVSGAEFIRRPGLRAMLDTLDPKGPDRYRAEPPGPRHDPHAGRRPGTGRGRRR